MQKLQIDPRLLWGITIRLAISLAAAGAFYTIWLGTFLTVSQNVEIETNLVSLLPAPFITALGFSLGARLGELLTRGRRSRLAGLYLWSLAGCVIGAGVVYPFGPMLIVFGMFLVGTLSLAVRELKQHVDEP